MYTLLFITHNVFQIKSTLKGENVRKQIFYIVCQTHFCVKLAAFLLGVYGGQERSVTPALLCVRHSSVPTLALHCECEPQHSGARKNQEIQNSYSTYHVCVMPSSLKVLLSLVGVGTRCSSAISRDSVSWQESSSVEILINHTYI